MARILVIYADAAHAEVPLIVCAEAGHDMSVAAATEAPDAPALECYDVLVVAVPDPIAIVAPYRAAGCKHPVIALADKLPASEQAELHRLGVTVLPRPYSIQTLRQAIARHGGANARVEVRWQADNALQR